MTLLGLIMAFFFVPKASQLAHLKIAVAERAPIRSLGDLAHAFNPMGVLRQFRYPNIVAAVSCSFPFPQLDSSPYSDIFRRTLPVDSWDSTNMVF